MFVGYLIERVSSRAIEQEAGQTQVSELALLIPLSNSWHWAVPVLKLPGRLLRCLVKAARLRRKPVRKRSLPGVNELFTRLLT